MESPPEAGDAVPDGDAQAADAAAGQSGGKPSLPQASGQPLPDASAADQQALTLPEGDPSATPASVQSAPIPPGGAAPVDGMPQTPPAPDRPPGPASAGSPRAAGAPGTPPEPARPATDSEALGRARQLQDALDQAASAKPAGAANPLVDLPKPGLEELVKGATPPVDPAGAAGDAAKFLDGLKDAAAGKPPA